MLSIRLVEFDEAKSFAGDVVMFGGILLCVSDEKSSADILNVEGSKVARDGCRHRTVLRRCSRA